MGLDGRADAIRQFGQRQLAQVLAGEGTIRAESGVCLGGDLSRGRSPYLDGRRPGFLHHPERAAMPGAPFHKIHLCTRNETQHLS